MATNTTQKQAAKQFVQDWSGKGYEKGETSRFWIALLSTLRSFCASGPFLQPLAFGRPKDLKNDSGRIVPADKKFVLSLEKCYICS